MGNLQGPRAAGGLAGLERVAPAKAEKKQALSSTQHPLETGTGTVGVNRRVRFAGTQNEHLRLKWVPTRGSTGRLAARAAC